MTTTEIKVMFIGDDKSRLDKLIRKALKEEEQGKYKVKENCSYVSPESELLKCNYSASYSNPYFTSKREYSPV